MFVCGDIQNFYIWQLYADICKTTIVYSATLCKRRFQRHFLVFLNTHKSKMFLWERDTPSQTLPPARLHWISQFSTPGVNSPALSIFITHDVTTHHHSSHSSSSLAIGSNPGRAINKNPLTEYLALSMSWTILRSSRWWHEDINE